MHTNDIRINSTNLWFFPLYIFIPSCFTFNIKSYPVWTYLALVILQASKNRDKMREGWFQEFGKYMTWQCVFSLYTWCTPPSKYILQVYTNPVCTSGEIWFRTLPLIILILSLLSSDSKAVLYLYARIILWHSFTTHIQPVVLDVSSKISKKIRICACNTCMFPTSSWMNEVFEMLCKLVFPPREILRFVLVICGVDYNNVFLVI